MHYRGIINDTAGCRGGTAGKGVVLPVDDRVFNNFCLTTGINPVGYSGREVQPAGCHVKIVCQRHDPIQADLHRQLAVLQSNLAVCPLGCNPNAVGNNAARTADQVNR